MDEATRSRSAPAFAARVAAAASVFVLGLLALPASGQVPVTITVPSEQKADQAQASPQDDGPATQLNEPERARSTNDAPSTATLPRTGAAISLLIGVGVVSIAIGGSLVLRTRSTHREGQP